MTTRQQHGTATTSSSMEEAFATRVTSFRNGTKKSRRTFFPTLLLHVLAAAAVVAAGGGTTRCCERRVSPAFVAFSNAATTCRHREFRETAPSSSFGVTAGQWRTAAATSETRMHVSTTTTSSSPTRTAPLEEELVQKQNQGEIVDQNNDPVADDIVNMSQQKVEMMQIQQQMESVAENFDVAGVVDAVEDKTEVVKQGILHRLREKIGQVDDDRIVFPEYDSGQVPRMFSSLTYDRVVSLDDAGGEKVVSAARHAAGSVLGAASLVAGTTIGAGVLALPAATASSGFVPSSAAMVVAWAYMTMSGLLVAELTLNKMGSSGKTGSGLLELYESSLGKPLSSVGSAAYFFLHYAMMVAYIAQGGTNLSNMFGSLGILESLTSIPGAGQVTFAAACGLAMYAAKPSVVEKVNNWLVGGVAASFLAIVGIGASGADFAALVDPVNQHPENVVGCFPILFLALVYQNVVPTVVQQLEGDRSKITKAIVGGTTMPLLMFLAWNAVVLGNVIGMDVDLANINPVSLLQSGAVDGASGLLGPLVTGFSSLALITSLIGFTYGLSDAWTDVLKVDTKGDQYENWKAALYGLVFVPPLALSVANPDIFYKALEYGGAFGVSTLFLVLPPLMVWNERYGKDKKPLITKPMVPLGKISLGSMWKAAATLIVEQGAEKLGVFDYIQDHFLT